MRSLINLLNFTPGIRWKRDEKKKNNNTPVYTKSSQQLFDRTPKSFFFFFGDPAQHPHVLRKTFAAAFVRPCRSIKIYCIPSISNTSVLSVRSLSGIGKDDRCIHSILRSDLFTLNNRHRQVCSTLSVSLRNQTQRRRPKAGREPCSQVDKELTSNCEVNGWRGKLNVLLSAGRWVQDASIENLHWSFLCRQKHFFNLPFRLHFKSECL